jgi:hypothetical protein
MFFTGFFVFFLEETTVNDIISSAMSMRNQQKHQHKVPSRLAQVLHFFEMNMVGEAPKVILFF